ncbi:hypothetical protein EHQ16_03100 [Leptospira kanakyensis]|uniref:Uncharacterized protein n=1 Tax=Leptospira kanakyensis TaxID=2484968 RepID=A0A6N4PUY4_9LEPT|nr:hypothetical protein [Leptospira kanakyensis]TGK47542.1 hypothetical protein EHQ11_16530 [Leptospira kanakyensis]TGK63455.1 hypothetical protein EHQ16_03100 [Leptospira kanakyensis]TGK67058.1 hypothetical protein EHQ18_18335 [Leptospira kanakyensis]
MGLWNRIRNRFFDNGVFLPFTWANDRKKLKENKAEIEAFLTEAVTEDNPSDDVRLIKKLARISPELSQAVKRALTLGNTGLEWEIDADERHKSAMLTEIDLFFDSLPGITNRLLRQTIVCGAISAEWIPSVNIDSVESIRTVPVSKIIFKRDVSLETGTVKFLPYEQTKHGYKKLNEIQYMYHAIETDEDSPYGIPPFFSAVPHVGSQFKAQSNMEKLLDKWGLLGFIVASFPKPRQLPGTDAAAYEHQLSEHLAKARAAFEKNSSSGFMATYDGVKTEHYALTDGARTGGYDSITRGIEEKVSSGIDTDLFLLGRSYSVTESYAKISGKLFLLKLKNIAYPTKLFLEQAIRFHLTAKGYSFRSVSAKWGKSITLDPKGEAEATKISNEATKIHYDLIRAQVADGLIAPDVGAKLLGFDKWEEPSKLEKQSADGLSFSEKKKSGKGSMIYLEEHTSNCICGDLNQFVMLGAWSSEEKKIYQAIEDSFAENFYSTYEDKVTGVLERIRKTDITKEDAIEKILDLIEQELGDLPDALEREWRKAISDAWDAGQEFHKGNDGKDIKAPKVNANKHVLDFFNSAYKFDVGKQFKKENDINDIRSAVEEGLESGSVDSVIKKLQDKLLGRTQTSSKDEREALRNKLDNIVRGQIYRARTFSRIKRYHQTGIARIEYVAVMDERTSSLCKSLNGKTVEVKTLVTYIDEFIEDDPTRDDFWKDRQNPSEKVAEGFKDLSGDEIMNKLKNKVSPFHLRCRTTTAAYFERRSS